MKLPTDPYDLQRLVERYKTRSEVVDRENDDLRQKLRALQGEDPDIALKAQLQLTTSETVILAELMRRECLTKSRASAVLYSQRMDDNIPEPKIVDVFVCKLRKKLKVHGIEISTAWGMGYYLTPEMKQTVASFSSDFGAMTA